MTASLLLIALLLACSAFFSASESALFALRREDRDWLQRRGGAAARCALELLARPRTLLVAVLFGNLIVNFLAMSLTARLVIPALGDGAGAVTLGVLATTGLVVVCGEVTPKALAVAAPRTIALLAARPLLAFRDASRPLTGPLERLVSWGLDRLEPRLPPAEGALTDLELSRFALLHGEAGALERDASEFLAAVLELGSRRVHEVMTPRVDVVAFDLGGTRDDFLALVREHRVSKVPVHRGAGLDTIDGYIQTRDVLRERERPLEELVRPLWFVPSTKSLESLLREMIARQELIALVVGEYGGTHGVVTLEDVVEEITGEITHDEHPLLRQGPTDRAWIAAGRFPLRELGEVLGVRFPPGHTTLSGWIAHSRGRLPEVGDVVYLAGIQFRVHALEGRRARDVVIALPEPGRRVPLASLDADVPDELTHSGAQRASQRLREWAEDAAPGPEAEPPTAQPREGAP